MTTSLGLKRRIGSRFNSVKEKIKTNFRKAKQSSIEKKNKIAKKHSSVDWPVVAGVILAVIFIGVIIALIFSHGDGNGGGGDSSHGANHFNVSLKNAGNAIDRYEDVKSVVKELQLEKEEKEKKKEKRNN